MFSCPVQCGRCGSSSCWACVVCASLRAGKKGFAFLKLWGLSPHTPTHPPTHPPHPPTHPPTPPTHPRTHARTLAHAQALSLSLSLSLPLALSPSLSRSLSLSLSFYSCCERSNSMLYKLLFEWGANYIQNRIAKSA